MNGVSASNGNAKQIQAGVLLLSGECKTRQEAMDRAGYSRTTARSGSPATRTDELIRRAAKARGVTNLGDICSAALETISKAVEAGDVQASGFVLKTAHEQGVSATIDTWREGSAIAAQHRLMRRMIRRGLYLALTNPERAAALIQAIDARLGVRNVSEQR